MYVLLLSFLLAAPLLVFFLAGRPSGQKGGGLRCYPIIGNLPQYVANRHRLLDWFAGLLHRSPTHTIFIRRLGVRGIVTANPANVEHILRANFSNYPKGNRSVSNLHDFLGQGIFNSDGEKWRVQRKTASFEFNTRSLRNFVASAVQHEISTRLLPFLARAAAGDPASTVDLQDVLEKFAFDNICKVAFDTDPACLRLDGEEGEGEGEERGVRVRVRAFPRAFQQAAFLTAERFRYAVPRSWKIKKLLNVGTERILGESITTVHEFAESIIRSRRKACRQGSDDLLSRFMASESCSDEFLRDMIISFLLAGQETTSSALSWFFWILSTRPDVERKVLEEVRTTRASRGLTVGEMMGLEDLRELQYLHAAISETLRFYPSVPLNAVVSLEDDVLPDGTEVRKGWFVTYSSYAMGRSESIWGKDALVYRPERWLDEDGAFRPESPFKFPAFHAGPRMCLGKEMAYIQMKSVAVSVLERFVVEVMDKARKPEYNLSLTLKMKHGLHVQLKERVQQEK